MKAEKYPAPGETRSAALVGFGDPGSCNSMGWIASLSAAISDIQKFPGKLKKNISVLLIKFGLKLTNGKDKRF